MLYYLFSYLDTSFNLPGAGVFQYISFRAGMSAIISLLITTVFGRHLINYLRHKQAGETVRNLGLSGETSKQGTPTMGGLIILIAILIPTLLFAKLDNIYILLMLFTMLWMGGIGFIDDYIKVFKKDKAGLAGRNKIIGQVICGLVVGLAMYYHPNIVIREQVNVQKNTLAPFKETVENRTATYIERSHLGKDVKSTKTNVPFYKNNEFDYANIFTFLGNDFRWLTPCFFVLVVVFIITAVSNGANITDGIDGLATGISGIIGLVLGAFAYVSGNLIFADYLNLVYIPHSGELMVFAGAFIGAAIGFLWYNAYPAQVFMGDTGSLALGGIIAAFAILIRKELLIPVFCGVFVAENLSVLIQVTYFKYTKYRFGIGKRIFLMAPLHHHFQKKGYHETKITTRFWIVGIILAILSVVTLKLR